MENLPSNKLTDDDVKLLQDAGSLIVEAQGLKEQPGKLRLKLVDIQAMRFEIGRRKVAYKGFARDFLGNRYRVHKQAKMSNNAAYKEAETEAEVIAYKNSADLFETAYEVMDSFVNTNQTSLRLAGEEAKNNL